MNWIVRFCRSSVGGKSLVAVTGAAMFLFVVVHMVGNLQIYIGQDTLNHYAELLQTLPELLWVARAGLLLFLVVHVVSSLRLAIQNRAARPVRYAGQGTLTATAASRTMVWTGPMIAAFIVYHVLHFTVGTVQPDAYHLVDDKGRYDVYSMVILGFQNVPIAVSYIVAMLLLGVHLRHGVASLFQTLGLRHRKYEHIVERVGLISAWVIVLGNVSIPLTILAGLVKLPSS